MTLAGANLVTAGALGVPAPSPWALTLDTLVAILGSIVTIVLAALALRQTARANGLQEEAHSAQAALHEHSRRFKLYQAMLQFIDAKETSGAALDEAMRMQMAAVETGFGNDAAELDWAHREAEKNADLYRAILRDAEGQPVDQASWYAYTAGRTLMERRLAHWVDSGDFPATE